MTKVILIFVLAVVIGLVIMDKNCLVILLYWILNQDSQGEGGLCNDYFPIAKENDSSEGLKMATSETEVNRYK